MLRCWCKDRTKRPKFTVIQETLEKWIGNPHLLLEIASFVTTGLVVMISCESLFFILMSIKRYFSAFFFTFFCGEILQILNFFLPVTP